MTLTEFLERLAEEPDWVDRGPVRIHSRSATGDTPLHVAVWWGDDEAARALVDAGADMNARGEEGCAPLHVALEKDNPAIARYLVSRGASWDVVDNFGKAPRYDAKASANREIRELLEEFE
jgi:uncharacterized protein